MSPMPQRSDGTVRLASKGQNPLDQFLGGVHLDLYKRHVVVLPPTQTDASGDPRAARFRRSALKFRARSVLIDRRSE